MRDYPNSIISFGAGVNSTAMIILLAKAGWRGPILFADTGTEWPDTLCFMHHFETHWLKPRGLAITIVGKEYREGRVRGGWQQLPLIEFCEHYRITPQAANRWCTQSWKVEPIKTWCKENGEYSEQLIGIAADEAHRAKRRPCPLIDLNVTRQGCIDIIQQEGLPIPRKSGCYICPFQPFAQWYELLTRYPDLYARAKNLEHLAAQRTGHRTPLRFKGDYTLDELEHAFAQGLHLPDDTEEYMGYKPCQCMT